MNIILETTLKIISKINPRLLWKLFSYKCSKKECRTPKFLLTFDCDTELDINVVLSVHERLAKIGIKPVYAVPGELIEKGLKEYKYLASQGVEFINHGYLQHTIFDKSQRKYISTIFYEKLSTDEIFADMEKGHEVLISKLKIKPIGFRTPHFGSFQSKRNLKTIHSKLYSLGYVFSSSTGPKYSFIKGPVYQTSGILEIPITGCPSWPLGILDSYGFRFTGSARFNTNVFEKELDKAFKMIQDGAMPRINLYADPSQVYDWEGFFDALSKFSPYTVSSFMDYIKD